MPTRDATPRKDKPDKRHDKKPEPKPLPHPEGDGQKAKPDDFDPLRRRDYQDRDGDAADPQRTGPGT